MKLRSVAFLTVVGAGTLISATAIGGSYLVSVITLSLLLTESTASSFIPLSVIGAVLLSSTPASAAEEEKVEKRLDGSTDIFKRWFGGGDNLNAEAMLAANVPKMGQQNIVGQVGLTVPFGPVALKGDISGSQNRYGRDVSAGAQVAVPLGGNSQLEFGGRSGNAFPNADKGGGSFPYSGSHVRLNKDFGGGLTGHVGANFPRGGAPQPHIGINFVRRF